MSNDEQMSRAIEIEVNPETVKDLLGQGADKTKALKIATEYKNGLDNATNNGPEDLVTINNLNEIIKILQTGGRRKSKKRMKSKKRRKTTKRRKV